MPADDLRQYYASLSEEGLREIDRDDLTDAARTFYDQELSSRGLTVEEPAPEPDPSPDDIIGWIPLDSFSDEEIGLVRALLDAEEIPNTMKLRPAENYPPVASGSLIFVPEPMLDRAREVLASQVSDEELIAEAESQPPPDDVEKLQ